MRDKTKQSAVMLLAVGLAWLVIGVMRLSEANWMTWLSFAVSAIFVFLGVTQWIKHRNHAGSPDPEQPAP
ncbi:hypothetical protein [Nocardiopsis ansamitocini]|uniref:hypothetical protein n=1 Tax=Nocardiopsis ansamitocini TaxID=1670832 RepID=UPI0025558DD3|nr:hypothetical protein [Nocardiopsis ansamitocini]